MVVSLNKCIEGHIALKGNISIGSPHIGHGNIEQTHTHTCCRHWQWQWWWQQCLKGHTQNGGQIWKCVICVFVQAVWSNPPEWPLFWNQTTNYSLPASAMMILLTLLVTEPINNELGSIFKFPQRIVSVMKRRFMGWDHLIDHPIDPVTLG